MKLIAIVFFFLTLAGCSYSTSALEINELITPDEVIEIDVDVEANNRDIEESIVIVESQDGTDEGKELKGQTIDEEELVEDSQQKTIEQPHPEIVINGPEILTVEFGSIYRELGASFFPTKPNYYINTIGFVNTFSLGEYEIHYQLINSIGEVVSAETRIVKVTDSTPPTISLIGSQYLRIKRGFPYIEMSVSTFDNYPSQPQIIISGAVDTNVPGIYYIYYKSIDFSGNESQVLTRIVEVFESHQTVILNSINYRDYVDLTFDTIPKACNTFNIRLSQNPFWEYDFTINLTYTYIETTPQSPVGTRRYGELTIRSNQNPRLPFFVNRCEIVNYNISRVQGTVKIPLN
jgi:hypothetical protein